MTCRLDHGPVTQPPPTESRELPRKSDLRYPVAFRNSRVCSVLYVTSGQAAERHLAGTLARPVIIGHSALLSLTWFDYADSDLGAYREFSVGVLCDTQGSVFKSATMAVLRRVMTLGAYVLSLPVTSELARLEGVERLGLPKTLLDLRLGWTPRLLDARVLDRGERVLGMQVPLGFGPKISVPTLVVYSKLGGELLRTSVATDFRPRVDLLSRPRLRLEAPDHPLCALLQSFSVDQATCVAVVHGPMPTASLLAPVVVGR